MLDWLFSQYAAVITNGELLGLILAFGFCCWKAGRMRAVAQYRKEVG